jgi:hypothetical protein
LPLAQGAPQVLRAQPVRLYAAVAQRSRQMRA